MHNIIIFVFAVLYCCSVSLPSGDVSPCAKWDSNGKVVAGDGISGDAPNQLSIPRGIFLMKKTRTLYVADLGNKRVQMFPLNQPSSSPSTVISNINTPSKIYVDDDRDGPTIYLSVFIGNRVEKWMNGAIEGIQLGDECRSCFGITVDEEKNVYMSESDRHRVVKWSPQTNLTTVVAGQTDTRGSYDEYLSKPDGIYFDRTTNTLYIADSGNNRIQKWEKNALSGVQVAGSNTSYPGEDVASLDEPNGVWVDEKTKTIYVADTTNNRIMRWLPNASVSDCIAGGQGSGNETNQLRDPSDLAFDNEGNLYVCDTWNNRVLMFPIIDNKPCSPTSTAKSQAFRLPSDAYNKWTMITIILLILTLIIGELY